MVLAGLNGFNDRLGGINRVLGLPDTIRHWDQILHDPAFGHTAKSLEQHATVLGGKLDDLTGWLIHKPVAEDALKVTKGVTKDLGYIGAITTLTVGTGNAFHAARQGDVGGEIRAVTDTTASTLKNLPSPQTYLTGFVISEYTDVFDAYRQIDWKQGIPAPTPDNLLHLYAPSFGDAVKQLPGHIFKWAT
jgi:hypothetical protein